MRTSPRLCFVVCTFNGRLRLPRTLDSLVGQLDGNEGTIEILVVDNASTDDTAGLLNDFRARAGSPRLRVTHEPRMGSAYARQRGLSEADTEYVAFVDDDNILEPDWARRAISLMDGNPNACACGGLNNSGELPVPTWFGSAKSLFALGPQGDSDGDVTESRGHLWGAGLCVRRSAWLQTNEAGFRPTLAGPQGRGRVQGDDTELCLAMRLGGWRLLYEPSLRLEHALASDRLTWPHACELARSSGTSSATLDAYHLVLDERRGLVRRPLAYRWYWRALRTVQDLAFCVPFSSEAKGSTRTLTACYLRGRLRALLRMRGSYDARFAVIRELAARIEAQRGLPCEEASLK